MPLVTDAHLELVLGVLYQVTIGLYRKAYKFLQSSAKKTEEEVQSLPEEHVETAGVIEAYMNLATFCDKRLREEEESDNSKPARKLPTTSVPLCRCKLRVLTVCNK